MYDRIYEPIFQEQLVDNTPQAARIKQAPEFDPGCGIKNEYVSLLIF